MDSLQVRLWEEALTPPESESERIKRKWNLFLVIRIYSGEHDDYTTFQMEEREGEEMTEQREKMSRNLIMKGNIRLGRVTV